MGMSMAEQSRYDISAENYDDHTAYTLTMSSYFDNRENELRQAARTVLDCLRRRRRINALTLMWNANLPDNIAFKKTHMAYSRVIATMKVMYEQQPHMTNLRTWRAYVIVDVPHKESV